MQICKIVIKNFRLLRDFSIDLEKELSLVIGKNNTGKTSILSALEKFLNASDRNKVHFDDFSIVFKNEIKELLESASDISEVDYIQKEISLDIFIEYNEKDNLANISKVMMDLDPANNFIVLGFNYSLDFEDYKKMKGEFKDFQASENDKKRNNAKYESKGCFDFLKKKHHSFFNYNRKSYEYNLASKLVEKKTFLDLDAELISTKDIVSFKQISARRDVTNREADKTLSAQTSQIYKRTESTDDQNKAVESFKDTLSDTDSNLSKIYLSLFQEIVNKVKSFGGLKPNETDIEIISTLQHRELLDGNTTVVYRHDAGNQLPEHFNGLGYMNLISMIFEIEILVQEFKREKDKKPADINLLFIEEPEAHTHPQMQYVFIKNIKKLLARGIEREDGEKRNLQYIISTHSSHIVADSDFDDIKYLKREDNNRVVSKNVKDLKKEYDTEPNQYQFLKQYLTISISEIFFADKAVLIEGDTEKMLLPTMMRKIDIEEEERVKAGGQSAQDLPLLSQNISIIEVGAYSQIFEKFIDFLGLRKTLIITDLDATDDKGKACPVSNGVSYSNGALNFFLSSPTLQQLVKFTINDKIVEKVAGSWQKKLDGKLCIVYQLFELGYHARSFEDAFINLNRKFVTDKKEQFRGLKNRLHFDDLNKDPYVLADECIIKKTHFALDILFHSDERFSNWLIPEYLKEGILWLKKD